MRGRGNGPIIYDSLDKPNADSKREQKPLELHMVYFYITLIVAIFIFSMFCILYVMHNLEYKIQNSLSITERNIALIAYNIIPYMLIIIILSFMMVGIYYVYVHAQKETRVNIYQSQLRHKDLRSLKEEIVSAIVPVMMEEMRQSLLRSVTTYTPSNSRVETTVMTDDEDDEITAGDDAALVPMSSLLP